MPESSEWFFRWIARAKAGHTAPDQAINIIWHHPDNPYFENNPWKTPQKDDEENGDE